MADKKVCPICGDVTSSYMGHFRKDGLCRKHAAALKAGEIAYCEECKAWYTVNAISECRTHYSAIPDWIFSDNCVLCGQLSEYNHLFCKKCYKSHSDSERLVILNHMPLRYTDLPDDGFERCVVCGEKTNGYAFCRDCYHEHTYEEMLDILNGCDDSSWLYGYVSMHTDGEPKKSQAVTNAPSHEASAPTSQKTSEEMHFYNKNECIICGNQVNSGGAFCLDCFNKYKNKELLFRVTGCSRFELLDQNYEGRYTCKDGHIVKSKSERDIDNYLFEHGISHAYERELYYGSTDKEVVRPDFCLPNYLGNGQDVYIEHWGYGEDNVDYTKSKDFKLSVYRKMGITLVCTYEKTDMGRIDTVLERKLNKAFIKPKTINFEVTKEAVSNANKGVERSNTSRSFGRKNTYGNDDLPF